MQICDFLQFMCIAYHSSYLYNSYELRLKCLFISVCQTDYESMSSEDRTVTTSLRLPPGLIQRIDGYLNLVRMRESTQSYRTIYITLTPLGKKVARRYQKIYEMIAVDA